MKLRYLALALVCICAAISGCQLDLDETAPKTVHLTPWDRQSVPSRAALRKALDQVAVLPSRPSESGYDRECGPANGCSFGPAWTDDHAAPMGHNGCGTRDDMLRATLADVGLRPGTNGCVVVDGRFHDPYTGRQIRFTKDQAHAVQVDHMYPLARAWDMGAHRWSITRRVTFANDPANLVVVDGPANASKGDSGPGEWLPINRKYRCIYLGRYLRVAHRYRLPITRSDRASIRLGARACPASANP